MDALSLTELLYLAIALAAASAVAGVVAGLLGVGGGIVIVPVLFWLFGAVGFEPTLIMPMAVATSMATIIATSIASARAHHRRGALDWDLVRRWGPFLGIGALAGGLAAGPIGGAGLAAIFGVVALLVAANLAIPKTLVIADRMPEAPGAQPAIAGATGFVSALMGIGGGTLGVPTMAAFSYPIHRAVGTAAAFGLIIAVPAVVGFVVSGWGVPGRPPGSLGYVNLVAAAIILPFTTTLAPVGARLAHALRPVWVKRAFALFLGITAVRMLMAAAG